LGRSKSDPARRRALAAELENGRPPGHPAAGGQTAAGAAPSARKRRTLADSALAAAEEFGGRVEEVIIHE